MQYIQKIRQTRVLWKEYIKSRIMNIAKGETIGQFETRAIFAKENQNIDKIVLKHNRYEELDRYFQLLASSREVNGRINGINLAFVSGPERMGKSTYIETNLKEFRRKKELVARVKPAYPPYTYLDTPESHENEQQMVPENEHYIILNFNFAHHGMIGFTGMLHIFHETIIKEIVDQCARMVKEEVLDAMTIVEILSAEHASGLLYIHIKDVMYAILRDCDPILLSSSALPLLKKLNDTITGEMINHKDFFQNGYYQKLITILQNDLKVNEIEAALRLFLSVGKRIEHEHRDEVYHNTWHETGIESTNFLFDVLNFLCGLGQYNKNAFLDYFFSEEKLQETGLKLRENNYIKQGNHIDIILTFLNIDSLMCYKNQDFWNFFDNIINRTMNRTGIRTHFPIVIEIGDWKTLADIQDMMQADISNPVVLDIPGYKLDRMHHTNLTEFFNERFLNNMVNRIGRNHDNWNKAIEAMADGTTIEEIELSSAEYIKKESIGFEAMINRTYLEPSMLPLINNGTAEYYMYRTLKMITRANGLLWTMRLHYTIESYNLPTFQALIKNNVLHKSYYTEDLSLDNMPQLPILRNIRDGYIRDRPLGYLLWRIKNFSVLWGSKYDIKLTREKEKTLANSDWHLRRRADYHVQSCYYPGYHYRKMQGEGGYGKQIID